MRINSIAYIDRSVATLSAIHGAVWRAVEVQGSLAENAAVRLTATIRSAVQAALESSKEIRRKVPPTRVPW